jgi:anaerobic magnesium-protoporphyrin IX monomethyl ester cyclase
MTVLVVNPNNRIRSKFAAVEPPLWAGLTASYLKADILDAEALDLTLDETVKAIETVNPNKVIIVVMGNNPSVSSTPKMPIAEAIADGLDIPVSLTGIHPIAVGGKYPVVKKPFEGFPDMPFDKLPMDKYVAHNWHCLDGSPRSPYASVYTSLGCPYDCFYCNIHTLYPDRRVQFRPIKDIVKEIDTLVYKYKVRNIKFWDELFALDESRVLAICKELEYYDLNIWAYARVDTITKPMLNAMKRAGINWLAYGFESADTGVRLHNGKRFKNDKVEQAIQLTKDANINIIGNFMFGLPGDTEDTMRDTFDFATNHLFEWVNFYTAKPYPGSKWYEDSVRNQNWKDYDQYGDKREKFRDFAFQYYFTYLKYIKMINNKFGGQAVNMIGEMLHDKPRTN